MNVVHAHTELAQAPEHYKPEQAPAKSFNLTSINEFNRLTKVMTKAWNQLYTVTSVSP